MTSFYSSYCLHASPCFLPEYYFSVAYSPANAGDTRDTGPIPESGKSLEEEMATHSSILAWKILWTEDPDGLYSPWGRKELDTTELRSIPFSVT